MEEQSVKMPSNENPVLKVSKYKEYAPKIRFLTFIQIEEQLRIMPHNVAQSTADKSAGSLLDTECLRLVCSLLISNLLKMYAFFILR
jgi:hypothetical protein